MKLWPALAAVVLGSIAITTPAGAFVKWAGPGYYLVEGYYLFSGPYPSNTTCEAVLVARPQQERDDTNAACIYEDTDPDADDN